jgi:hypothetical protein
MRAGGLEPGTGPRSLREFLGGQRNEWTTNFAHNAAEICSTDLADGPFQAVRSAAWAVRTPLTGVAQEGRILAPRVFTGDGDDLPASRSLLLSPSDDPGRRHLSGRGTCDDDAGRGGRVHDQRLWSGPDQLLHAGIRGLRDAGNDVEEGVRPGGAGAPRSGHVERGAIGPGVTRSAVVLRDEGAGRNTVQATELVRPGTPTRLPVRTPTLGKQAGRPGRADQERESEPAMPTPQARPGSRMG